MRKRYKYKIKISPHGAYIETTFTYKELALFAILIWKWQGLGYKEDEEMMEKANEHINGLLDQIDEDRDKNQTCEKSRD